MKTLVIKGTLSAAGFGAKVTEAERVYVVDEDQARIVKDRFGATGPCAVEEAARAEREGAEVVEA